MTVTSTVRSALPDPLKTAGRSLSVCVHTGSRM